MTGDIDEQSVETAISNEHTRFYRKNIDTYMALTRKKIYIFWKILAKITYFLIMYFISFHSYIYLIYLMYYKMYIF
jgi:hypothetical protein